MDSPPLELRWLASDAPPDSFPDPNTALRYPNGLLVAGGDLSIARLLCAYRRGIFPWYSDPQPILWWSPDPRCVIFTDRLNLSRSLRKQLRHGGYAVSFDTAFDEVVTACAAPRRHSPTGGTWITPAMQTAYSELHRRGYAHSIEIRMHGELAGGLYGVALGGVFFGESMFSHRPNASKIALACLTRQLRAWGFHMLDCQLPSPHLARLGSVCLPRAEFLERLSHCLTLPGKGGSWLFETALTF
jgi:leucyl/phenylalanyl-tRNA--protein transferase